MHVCIEMLDTLAFLLSLFSLELGRDGDKEVKTIVFFLRLHLFGCWAVVWFTLLFRRT